MAKEDSTKDRIVAAIAECSDNNLRAVLLLMLAVLEEIGEKIDIAMSDEKSLRELVLNGHSEVHSDDHDWLFRMRPIIGRWSDTISWAESFRGMRKDGVCEYAREQIEARTKNTESRRKIGEDLIVHLLVAISSVLATALSIGFYFVLHGKGL